MKLKQFIKTYYDCNRAEFGRDNGLSRQQVWNMLKDDNYYVFDFVLMRVKQEIKEVEEKK